MHQAIATPTAPTTAFPPGLFRRWAHSREESQGEILVYRPHTFAFPPGPARHNFEVRPDGVFTDYHPVPGGGLIRFHGRWTQTNPDTIAASFAEIGRDGYSLAIVALDEGVPGGATLRVRRLPGRHLFPSDGARLDAYLALPPATLSRRLDWDEAGLQILESFPPQFRLAVGGTKPFLGLTVALQPLVYYARPDYWVIELVGQLRNFDLPAQMPFSLVLPLDGAVGTKGIELRGATKRQRFDLPTE